MVLSNYQLLSYKILRPRDFSDDCIGKKLAVTIQHWFCVYSIQSWIYIYSISKVKHFLFINIANHINILLMYIYLFIY